MAIESINSTRKTREDEELQKRNQTQQGRIVNQQQVDENKNTVGVIRADNTQVAQANAVQGPQPASETDEQKKIST